MGGQVGMSANSFEPSANDAYRVSNTQSKNLGFLTKNGLYPDIFVRIRFVLRGRTG